jgi:hypothetical protein
MSSWRVHDETRDRGAIMVEFALILPILVILVFGIIEFGRAYNTQIALQGAAREGARALALADAASAVQAVDDSHGLSTVVSVGFPDGSCPVNPDPDPRKVVYRTVTTSTNIPFSVPFFTIGTLTLKAEASMRCGL